MTRYPTPFRPISLLGVSPRVPRRGYLRFRAPANAARPGGTLSSVLGAAQVKVAEFAPEFNRLTQEYDPGVPLGVRLTRRGGKFSFRVAPPAVWLLLDGVGEARAVAREDLWGVLLFRGCATPAGARTVLGTLRAGRWTVR